MFGFMKKKVDAQVNKFNGQTDFLEAVCAASALVAAGDGDISDEEIAATKKAVMSNKALADGFDPRVVEQTIDRMLDRAKGGRTGQAGLKQEIKEAATDSDRKMAIMYSALDVAESDGEIGADEKRVLESIAKSIGLDLERILAE